MSYKNYPRWVPPALFLLAWLGIDRLVLTEASQLWFTRTMLLAGTAWLLIANRHRFAAMWNQEGSGFNLAVWRVLFFGCICSGYFIFGRQHIETALFSMTGMPDSARTPLPLLGPLTYMIPVTISLSRIGVYIMIASSFLACIGFKTRAAVCAFVVSALYVLGVPQLFGKVNHNHYLVWFPAILAFSGCGDLLSVDCWLRNRSRRACFRSQQQKIYGKAFAATWLLMGIIYFFPGFQKLWQSGLNWIFSENLGDLVREKALGVPGWQPVVSLEGRPLLCTLLAAGAVVFELGFIFFVPDPGLRRLGIFGGLLFHLGTWLLLGIFFQFLLLAYLTFVNWEKLLRIRPAGLIDHKPAPESKALGAVTAFLLWGNIFCGFFNIHSWPLTCFPTFANMPGNTAEVLEFVRISNTGNEVVPLDTLLRTYPPERYRALELKAIRLSQEKKQEELHALLSTLTAGVSHAHPLKVYLVKITWKDGKTLRVREANAICELN